MSRRGVGDEEGMKFEEDEATRMNICPATEHSDKPHRKITIEKSRILHYWVVNLKP